MEEKKKLTPIRGWIKKSLEIYFKKENLIYLTKFALLILLVQGALYLISFLVLGPEFTETQGETFPQLPPFSGSLLGGLVVGVIIFVFLGSWLYIATIKAVSQVLENKTLGVRETLKISINRILPFVGTVILTGIIVLLGFILLIIPGIIFMIWFYFSQYIVATEDVGPIAALKRSRELVKGYFWPILGRVIVMFLYTWLISLVLGLVLFPLVQMVLLGLVAPYFYLLPYFLYHELKEIKSGKSETSG